MPQFDRLIALTGGKIVQRRVIDARGIHEPKQAMEDATACGHQLAFGQIQAPGRAQRWLDQARHILL